MKICFITYKYPGNHNTSDYAFVKQLVDAIAEHGNYCIVLAPFNITHYKRLSTKKEYYTIGNGSVTILRPGYLSFSQLHIGHFHISKWAHKRALNRAFNMLTEKPDVIYGHFWSSAYDGFEYAQKNHIPLFVATGESSISALFTIPKDIKEFGNYVSGVICVSSKNMNESIELGLTTADKCAVFPNSINAELFKTMDKQQCRKQLGLPLDVYIVAFVGWFNDRKGSVRVSEAIKRITGEKVYSLFIGKGNQIPNCENILYMGTLPHNQVPLYLNAADVFVLPTLHEGCCNAVVEALACGLPIISSNLPFNWDVLDESNSIMIDPKDIGEISYAIKELRDNKEKRRNLSKEALARAQNLTIEQRAQNIIKFIERKQ